MPNDLLHDPGNLMEQARRNPLRTIRRLRAAGYVVTVSVYPDAECASGLLPYQVLISRHGTAVMPRAGGVTFTQAFCMALAQAIKVGRL